MATQKKKQNQTIPTVMIYTDGSCSPNPGIGGWAGIITHQNYQRELFGGFQHTSSNRMEMMAFIKCLESLTRKHVVYLYSDSRYLVTPIQQGKIKQWVKASNSGKFVKNIDLWKKLLYYSREHIIHATWIKGHNKNTNNERCDKLAKMIRTIQDPSQLEIDTEYIKSIQSIHYQKSNVQPVAQQESLLQHA